MRVSRATLRHWENQRQAARLAAKPESRPKCPACYGMGTALSPWDQITELRCDYCDGQGFNPYWMGPDQSQGEARDGD